MNEKMIDFLIKKIIKFPYVKNAHKLYAKFEINHPRTDHILIFKEGKEKVMDSTHTFIRVECNYPIKINKVIISYIGLYIVFWVCHDNMVNYIPIVDYRGNLNPEGIAYPDPFRKFLKSSKYIFKGW